MVEITLSRKQQTAFQILDDPSVVEVTFGGGAGGGKSRLVCTWSSIQCRRYPGIRIGLGRKEVSNLRKTTAQTFLGEVHPVFGIKDGRDFRYAPLVDPGIYYANTSQVLFTDLAPAPSDPNYDRLGSLNLTHVIIEEAGEVVREAAKVFTSRATAT
jgi:phage terminase large subunit